MNKDNWQWCNVGGKMCGAKFITWAGGGQLCYGDVSPERTSTCEPGCTLIEDQKLLNEIKDAVTKHFDQKKKQVEATKT